MPVSGKIVVITNCASKREAARIARALVGRREAACVNVISAAAQSTYRWQGRIETANEFTLLVKTTGAKFKNVARTIRELHSYAVPEIIALPVVAGSRDYLSWIDNSLSKAVRR